MLQRLMIILSAVFLGCLITGGVLSMAVLYSDTIAQDIEAEVFMGRINGMFSTIDRAGRESASG